MNKKDEWRYMALDAARFLAYLAAIGLIVAAFIL